MNILDSSAWIEYFIGSVFAAHFTSIIEDQNSLLIPSIVLYETFKRFYQQYGKATALEVIALMRQRMVVPLDLELAISAAEISSEKKLAMADSIILATARKYDATIWTLDSDFREMPKVKYFKK